ncbi:MAG: FtsX-like permease family protein [Halioglobus sp.]|nr:FtsX-like permease family protein [Halioglobus sp.]
MRTALRMLARDWRGGELGVLVAALVLAVGVVSGISAFTTRLQNALELESHRFLAADTVVRSGRELPGGWLAEGESRGLATALVLSFPTMVFAGEDNMYLASVKAVSDDYPLRGELQYSSGPFAAAGVVGQGPQRGEVWLDSRLFPLLDVAVGDSVSIGDASFTVAAAARTEPDQVSSFAGYGPRLLMHYDDIAATAVVQPGSRVEYRQLYAGGEEAVAGFTQWLDTQLEYGQRLMRVEDGQPGISAALSRAESFLLLAGSLAVVLAGVAVALAARHFSERHTDYVAIMKSLGATAGRVSILYGGSLLLLGVLATLAGCLVGWSIQAFFFTLFADQLPVQPGPAGVRPYAIGAATSLVCLLSFAWPPLRRLSLASPLRVLRRDVPHQNVRTSVDYVIGFSAVSLLMLWYSQDWRLTLAVLSGLLLTGALGLVLALSLLRTGRLVGMSAGSIWRLALAGLQRRGTANSLQVVIFAMAIMLLLMLILVRTSLISEWQMQLPEDAPNHFMINVAPEDVAGIRATLAGRDIPSEPLFPMVRGRIMSVNGSDLPATDDPGEERRQRESNLTWSAQLPADNRIVAGSWWDDGGAAGEALVSLEEEYAQRLGVQVGDSLGFLIGDMPLQARVSSIRRLDWQSLRPNFFLVFPPGVLDAFPATYMTSFHLDVADKLFLNRFIRDFPTVTVIEMDIVIEQIRTIIDQVSGAIELVLMLILVAGALVLVAGVRASVDTRMQESAILRALGARRGLILGGLVIEFAALGLFAGLLATLAAELSVYMLQTQAMDMSYVPSPWIWPLGITAGMVIIALLGVYACRSVVSTPPVAVLRELA